MSFQHRLFCVGRLAVLAVAGVAGAMSCVAVHAREVSAGGGATVEIRRGHDGIPHIRAGDWHGAGLGMGHAQAEDALCTLADAFVTFEGRRAYFFGAEARPQYRATFTGAKNIELDMFFRAFLDAPTLNAFKEEQPSDLLAMIDGYVEGYNRYLQTARKLRSGSANRTCASAEWTRPITVDDLLRRMLAATLAAGYGHFIPEIVNAQPPANASRLPTENRPRPPYQVSTVGDAEELGSNMIAFGQDAAGEGSVLFGNPHWYWGGPDRFYQARLTIPGHLNVAGVTFLGVPVIMLGFNEQVAWSHTVSKARRFGLYAIQLSDEDPTSYRVDGRAEPMERTLVRVPVRDARGVVSTVERTLFRTRFGPLLDLGAKAQALGWTQHSAVAIRDVNAGNHRVFRNYLAWNRARSLEEFVRIQRQELAMPWVNTAAIGRGDGRAWYGDVGAVPNVPDTLKLSCKTALGDAFARLDPSVPFLDGSRSACAWLTDPGAPQAGAMPAASLPGLFRRDYVANMNDSYWLASPRQPLEGFAAVLGGEREALSLRGRHGHALAQRAIETGLGNSSRLLKSLKNDVLAARDHAADLFKPTLLAGACAEDRVTVARDILTDKRYDPPKNLDVSHACMVLKAWGNAAGPADRGALLWDAFWARVRRISDKELFLVPFSPEHVLDTPAMPRQEDPRVAEALGAAVLSLSESGRPLDQAVGQYLYSRASGQRVSLFGGCGGGYFTIACPVGGPKNGVMDQRAHANTYLQIVHFGPTGVEAFTLLAHGESESAISGGPGGVLVRDYASRRWRHTRLDRERVDAAGTSVLRLKQDAGRPAAARPRHLMHHRK